MKLRLCMSALVACQASLAFAQGTPAAPAEIAVRRVLFIGNSYTYYNNMPDIVGAFTAMTDKPLEIKAQTMPAAQLSMVWGLRTTTYAFKDSKWDFVVLQEQSTLPLTSPGRMHDSIRAIDAAIRQGGARTVLYMTWSRQNLPDTQAGITAAYASIGSELGVLVAPVGSAWRNALQLDPTLPLYDSDGTHPSPTGSYLAACTLFLVITSSKQACPPLELAGVTVGDAEKVRAAAQRTVMDSTSRSPPTN